MDVVHVYHNAWEGVIFFFYADFKLAGVCIFYFLEQTITFSGS